MSFCVLYNVVLEYHSVQNSPWRSIISLPVKIIDIQKLVFSAFGLTIRGMLFLFDLILYVPSTIFQLNRDGSSWVEPVLS